jgi:F0F1-type ATP synthase membrane subunit b/b'
LETDEADLRWPVKRSQLYQDLIKVQLANSERKTRLVANLAKEHSDTLSKANIDKWNEHLKMINQAFDTEVDAIIKKLMEEVEET